jgi:hypothetical protein
VEIGECYPLIFNSPSALVTTTGSVYPKPVSGTRHISPDRPSGEVSPKEGSTAHGARCHRRHGIGLKEN